DGRERREHFVEQRDGRDALGLLTLAELDDGLFVLRGEEVEVEDGFSLSGQDAALAFLVLDELVHPVAELQGETVRGGFAFGCEASLPFRRHLGLQGAQLLAELGLELSYQLGLHGFDIHYWFLRK